MITTFTLNNGKEMNNLIFSDKTIIKFENRFAIELALGRLLESHNIKIISINHYEDNGDLIDNIPLHNIVRE